MAAMTGVYYDGAHLRLVQAPLPRGPAVIGDLNTNMRAATATHPHDDVRTLPGFFFGGKKAAAVATEARGAPYHGQGVVQECASAGASKSSSGTWRRRC
jgi:hypothetical protein